MARVEKIAVVLGAVFLALNACGLIFSAKVFMPFILVSLAAIMYLLFAGVYFATEWPKSRMNKWFQGSAKNSSKAS